MLELGPIVVVKGCMESILRDVPRELLELLLTVCKDSRSKEQQNEEQRTQEGNRTTRHCLVEEIGRNKQSGRKK